MIRSERLSSVASAGANIYFLSGYKRISSSPVTAGLSIDGYLIFEIPTNITTAQLKYGDYVTINIKPSDIKSK